MLFWVVSISLGFPGFSLGILCFLCLLNIEVFLGIGLGIYLVYTALLSWDCPFANCWYWATGHCSLGSVWTIFGYCFGLGLVIMC